MRLNSFRKNNKLNFILEVSGQFLGELLELRRN